MSLWRQISRGLRVLTARRAADSEVAEEVEYYLDQATAAHVARGLSPAAARRAAQLEMGNMTVVREAVRAYGWENAVWTSLGDLRYAARRLRSHPGFATVSVLTLALGIGATTAIFSAVNPILFEPLPYPRANRILMISGIRADGSPIDLTFGNYVELAARSRSFSALAVADRWQPSLTGTAEPERLEGDGVSASYFRALGVAPMLGRDFETRDNEVNGPKVAIVSEGLLQRRFGGDRTVVGRSIQLNGDVYMVIGVMPPAFENVLAPSAEIWAPLHDRPNAPFNSREWGHHYRVFGRLRPGVTVEAAKRELDAIARNAVPEFPRPTWANLHPEGLMVHSLQDQITRDVRPALVAVIGAVLLVLGIACVNVTNLLLARAAQRRGEFAMRSALGAGRWRLVRQLLTETLLLAGLGAVIGLGVGELGVRALVALSPPGLPRAAAIRLDAPVFCFSLGVATLVGLLVGLAPALDASRRDLHASMQVDSRRTAGRRGRARRALVVTEVALALVLLVSAGLLLRSFERLFAVAPGFDPAHVLSMQVVEAGHGFDADSARYGFFAEAVEAVRRVPGVLSAAFTSQLPLSGEKDEYGYEFQSICLQSSLQVPVGVLVSRGAAISVAT